VWHGALSPHAVLFDSVGCCQVADFRIVEHDEHREDEPPLPAKSPAYHPPELRVRRSVAAGSQVDQYALALIVHELLTGERRETQLGFGVTTAESIEIPPHRELRPGLSRRVNEVLTRATAFDPGARYESVDAFADALAEACVPDGDAVAPGVLAAKQRRSRRWTRVNADGTESLSPVTRFLVATGGVMALLLLFLGYIFTAQTSRGAGSPAQARVLAVGAGAGTDAESRSRVAPGPDGVSAADLALLQARSRLGGLLVVPIGGGVGAAAIVDGVDRGAVPRTVRLTPGTHTVQLRDTRRRYAPAETTVTVTSGALLTVNFRPVE
jgi:hypothetical protein